MEAVMRILRYIEDMPCRDIVFGRHGHLDVEVFTDATG